MIHWVLEASFVAYGRSQYFVDICHHLDDVAPNALLLNYVNPMAAVCWAVDVISGRPCVGLCHSIQESITLLAEWVGVPEGEISFLCAGINHFAFFLELQRIGPNGKQDLYPLIWKAIERPEVLDQEPVRIELMKSFGYFCTEASGHNSEYVPYFRKNEQDDQRGSGSSYSRARATTTGLIMAEQAAIYVTVSSESLRRRKISSGLISGVKELPSERSIEYGPYVIEAIETNQPVAVYGNVPIMGSSRIW